jgi:hypothetical protein
VVLTQPYPAREEDCSIDIFRTGYPAKEFTKITRVDVHLEKTHFVPSSFESALSELKRQACLSGADAVVDIEERSSSHLETRGYHVTGTGIKYKQ